MNETPSAEAAALPGQQQVEIDQTENDWKEEEEVITRYESKGGGSLGARALT
jgi:hypothetical protein